MKYLILTHTFCLLLFFTFLVTAVETVEAQGSLPFNLGTSIEDGGDGSAIEDGEDSSAIEDGDANLGGGSAGGIGEGKVTIKNPLAAKSITQFFLDIIEILLIFAIPIIVLFIILAGFKFVTAQGNAESIKDAKRALLYAIIGGLLILGANLILAVIKNTVDSFTV